MYRSLVCFGSGKEIIEAAVVVQHRPSSCQEVNGLTAGHFPPPPPPSPHMPSLYQVNTMIQSKVEMPISERPGYSFFVYTGRRKEIDGYLYTTVHLFGDSTRNKSTFYIVLCEEFVSRSQVPGQPNPPTRLLFNEKKKYNQTENGESPTLKRNPFCCLHPLSTCIFRHFKTLFQPPPHQTLILKPKEK
ncbi:hypothetical protein OUZ56_031890 [Daphnia magna]|uniref:UDENN domain-containing protein n=1 Tax=Daphnia magna TaxID=35525 RepID=A0ABQ9ZW99_9CRUS|nr:hypothetical protein OUZ56_031890 [Daphnia magna]